MVKIHQTREVNESNLRARILLVVTPSCLRDCSGFRKTGSLPWSDQGGKGVLCK